ncbi:MAG: TetR family transcriptional regulator [Polyangiaceae bacterium]|nr:TetR family transcriptional regulator [Polyangiaceae bacterium]
MMLASEPFDASQPPGLRERKKAEARAAIIRSALELFRKRGYGSVTIDEIAERAGVGRRTYFRYFPTKEAVVLDRRVTQLERFRLALDEAPESAPILDVLRQSFVLIAEDYRANRDRIQAERMLFRSSPDLAARDLAIDREFEQVIAKTVMARSGRSAAAQRGARFFAAAAMGVVRVLIDEWAEEEGSLDLVKIGNPAFDALEALLVEPVPAAARPATAPRKSNAPGSRGASK